MQMATELGFAILYGDPDLLLVSNFKRIRHMLSNVFVNANQNYIFKFDMKKPLEN